MRNSNFIAITKLRDTLQGDMKTEGVSKTMVVAFILFQHSVYRQMKMIQSQGVWESPLMNQNSIQEEIKSRLKSGMLAIIQFRIFCLPVCSPKILRYTELQGDQKVCASGDYNTESRCTETF